MAKKPTAKTTPVNLTILAAIVAATLDTSKGFAYVSHANGLPLVEAGLIEVNPEILDNEGNAQAKATEAGVKLVKDSEPKTAAAKPAFSLETGIPVPPARRGGRGGESYPFSKMEVGASFFVAASEEMPEPAKTLASTVSSATARFAIPTGESKTNRKGEPVPVMKETKKFIVRSVEENGIKGARVWRTV